MVLLGLAVLALRHRVLPAWAADRLWLFLGAAAPAERVAEPV